MQTVLIVIHLMIVLALVAVVLLQRSEGGGLGIGGGGNMMSSRSSGNALTRITGILAFVFFVTSLSLGILARYEQGPSSILDQIESQTQGGGDGILDQLGGAGASDTPAAPEGEETAPPSGDDAAAPAGEGETPAADEAPSGSEIPTGQ